MVDAETALTVILQDVMNDVMGMRLPLLPRTLPPEERKGDGPIEFGYDTTNRRTVKFAFGDSVVTVVCGKTLHSGAAVGVSHGSYAVKVGALATALIALVLHKFTDKRWHQQCRRHNCRRAGNGRQLRFSPWRPEQCHSGNGAVDSSKN